MSGVLEKDKAARPTMRDIDLRIAMMEQLGVLAAVQGVYLPMPMPMPAHAAYSPTLPAHPVGDNKTHKVRQVRLPNPGWALSLAGGGIVLGLLLGGLMPRRSSPLPACPVVSCPLAPCSEKAERVGRHTANVPSTEQRTTEEPAPAEKGASAADKAASRFKKKRHIESGQEVYIHGERRSRATDKAVMGRLVLVGIHLFWRTSGSWLIPGQESMLGAATTGGSAGQ